MFWILMGNQTALKNFRESQWGNLMFAKGFRIHIAIGNLMFAKRFRPAIAMGNLMVLKRLLRYEI